MHEAWSGHYSISLNLCLLMQSYRKIRQTQPESVASFVQGQNDQSHILNCVPHLQKLHTQGEASLTEPAPFPQTLTLCISGSCRILNSPGTKNYTQVVVTDSSHLFNTELWGHEY